MDQVFSRRLRYFLSFMRARVCRVVLNIQCETENLHNALLARGVLEVSWVELLERSGKAVEKWTGK